MYITMQNLITASAVLAAALALLGSYNRAYNWYRKQEKQDEDIGDCNGPVTEAIGRIEKHLNQKAHK